MAEKSIKLARLMLRGPISPEWVLETPGTVAEALGIHEKHVFRLIRDGHLERRVITDSHGRAIGSGITQDSIQRYRKHQRRNPRQLDLVDDVT